MPLYLGATHSSRVRKPGSTSSLKKSSSSLFINSPRTKPLPRSKSLVEAPEDVHTSDGLNSPLSGKPVPATALANVRDVLSALTSATSTMFSPVPTERSGMSSTRIAQVLNFRGALPPVVSLAHVHALVGASTQTERETASLIQAGKVRKLKLTGRGTDLAGLSEMLISTDDLTELVKGATLAADIETSFLDLLAQNPRATSFPASALQLSHATALIRAGFLVAATASSSSTPSQGISTGTASAPAVSRGTTGHWTAVRGDASFEELGGVGTSRPSALPSSGSNTFSLSVPSLGPAVRLLRAARDHLVSLLTPRGEPLTMLRERWDGAVADAGNKVSAAKRVRGEFAGVLPGRTKKWRGLWGVECEWALAEALGAGIAEVFETGSVGLGVRAV